MVILTVNNHQTLIMAKHSAMCITEFLFNKRAKWEEVLSNPGRASF